MTVLMLGQNPFLHIMIAPLIVSLHFSRPFHTLILFWRQHACILLQEILDSRQKLDAPLRSLPACISPPCPCFLLLPTTLFPCSLFWHVKNNKCYTAWWFFFIFVNRRYYNVLPPPPTKKFFRNLLCRRSACWEGSHLRECLRVCVCMGVCLCNRIIWEAFAQLLSNLHLMSKTWLSSFSLHAAREA